MRILVLGGSGQTGRLVIDEALRRGHKVTALVRKRTAVPAATGLTIVEGTPVDASSVEKAFNAVQGDIPAAVIVTLASPKEPGSRVMSDAHENLITAMKMYGVSKIVTMASFGVGSSYPYITPLMRWAITYTSMSHLFADHNQVDQILKKSDLDFVILRPTRLSMGSKKARVHYYGDEGKGMGGIFAGLGGISRASVAASLVDATEKSTWDRTTPVITN